MEAPGHGVAGRRAPAAGRRQGDTPTTSGVADAFTSTGKIGAVSLELDKTVPGLFYRGLVVGLLVVLPFWAAVGRAVLHVV